MKSKISFMLTPTPPMFQRTLFLDVTTERGTDTHTIGISIHEMQPLCLSYCTQMVNTGLAPPQKPLWDTMMSQPNS
jgi:hypothetical protein